MIPVRRLHATLTHHLDVATLTYHHPDAREIGVTHVPVTNDEAALLPHVRALIEAGLTPRRYQFGNRETTHAPTLHWWILHLRDQGHSIEAIVTYEGLERAVSVHIPIPEAHAAPVHAIHQRLRAHATLD